MSGCGKKWQYRCKGEQCGGVLSAKKKRDWCMKWTLFWGRLRSVESQILTNQMRVLT